MRQGHLLESLADQVGNDLNLSGYSFTFAAWKGYCSCAGNSTLGYCKVLACAKKGNKPSSMGEKRSDIGFPPIG